MTQPQSDCLQEESPSGPYSNFMAIVPVLEEIKVAFPTVMTSNITAPNCPMSVETEYPSASAFCMFHPTGDEVDSLKSANVMDNSFK